MAKLSSVGIAFNQKPKVVDNVLKGVVMARIGPAKGHKMHIDSEFLSRIVELGNAQPQGVKSRFGHPNASSTTLGTYIGRFKNFRVDGDQSLADLHVDLEVANASPGREGLGDYIVKMARKNPDMMGNSVVFPKSEPEIRELEVLSSEDTREDEVLAELSDGRKRVRRSFARPEALPASDIVDSPAATESMFSQFTVDTDFAALATNFFDNNPLMFKLLCENPEVFEGFKARYNAQKEQQEQVNKQLPDMKDKELSILQKAVVSLGAAVGLTNFSAEESEAPEAPEAPEAEAEPEAPAPEVAPEAEPEPEAPEAPEAEPEALSAEAVELAELKASTELAAVELAAANAKIAQLSTAETPLGAVTDPIPVIADTNTTLSAYDKMASKINAENKA